MVLRTSYPKDFKALNEALKNSFSGIKKDMDSILSEIRSSQIASTASAKELRQEIEGLKQQSVSVDKFNIVKIRLAEFGEQLRKLDKVERAIQDLEYKTSAITKLSKAHDDLKAEVANVDATAKAAISDSQMRKLVEEINTEFNAVRATVTGIEDKGGRVADQRIERFSEQAEGKLNELRTRVQRLQDVTAEQVKRSSVETLITDVNAEFDRVKDSVQKVRDDVKELREEIKGLRREAASKEDMDDQFKQLRKLAAASRDMPKSMIFPESPRSKTMLKDALMKLGKKRDKVVVMDEAPKPRSRLLIASTSIIILSFLGLGASVTAFFLDYTDIMDYLIIASIAVFILGIILRVIALIHEEAADE